MRRGVVVVASAVGVVALVAALLAGVRWWQERDRTPIEQATAYAPADAERLTWTDWAGIRERLDADVDAASSGGEVEDFLDDAFERDLSSGSALVGSAPVLQRHFGFSPATLEWELFSQSSAGAVVVLRVPDADLDDVAADLAELGYAEPADEDGVWEGGPDLLPEIGAGLTPELQYVALVADEQLVLTSDRADYLEEVIAGLGEGSLPEPVTDAVEASGSPLSAVVYDGDHACSALAMSRADREDQEAAERLVAEAGGVDPVAAYAMSAQPDGEVRVALAFAGSEQARANADARAALASGPAPGQGGAFTDRFAVESATADGDVVTLELTPVEGAYVLSDLSSGPVLFATC